MFHVPDTMIIYLKIQHRHLEMTAASVAKNCGYSLL